MAKRKKDKGAFPYRKDFFPAREMLCFLSLGGFGIHSHCGWMNLFLGQIFNLLNRVNSERPIQRQPFPIGIYGRSEGVNGFRWFATGYGNSCSAKHSFPV
jgi:hypothetical protein